MGANRWREAREWPPAEARPRKLYLESRGKANTMDGDGAHRTVRFVGPAELQNADFVAVETLQPVHAPAEALPFWTVRAKRPHADPAGPASSEAERLGEIAARGPTTAAELELLRLWFSLDPPRALLDHALRASGVALPHHPRGRAIFYSESSIISSHWEIQPDVRGIANRTVNMPTGMCSAS